MTTPRQLITGALRLINVVQANENPTAADMNISFEALNAMLDSWSTEKLSIFSMNPYEFVLEPNVREYTLGTDGDWDIERPMEPTMMYVIYGDEVPPPEPPVASFTYVKDNPNLQATFTDTSTGDPTSWVWEVDDVEVSTDQNPTIQFGAYGVDYEVRLTVANEDGQSSTTQTVRLVSPITFTLNNDTYPYVYQTQYLAFVDPYSYSERYFIPFNTFAQPAPNTTYPTNYKAWMNPFSGQTAPISGNMNNSVRYWIWEIVVGDDSPTYGLQVGMANGYTDPSYPYGRADSFGNTAYWASDGRLVDSLNNVQTIDGFEGGDILGCIYETDQSGGTFRFHVFKNGVHVGSTLNPGGQNAMVGTWPK